MVGGIQLRPIGHVACPRIEAIDDDWGSIESTITLDADRFEADVLAGLEDFSHVEIVFCFDQSKPEIPLPNSVDSDTCG